MKKKIINMNIINNNNNIINNNNNFSQNMNIIKDAIMNAQVVLVVHQIIYTYVKKFLFVKTIII